MKNKFSPIISVVLIMLALCGCQSSPQKNVASVANIKCAPMHNLSQEKRKACTGQAVQNRNGQDSNVSEIEDKTLINKS